MAMPTATPAAAHSAQVVGNAFVEQYYHILHQSPELVYRFYQDSSVLSRPEPNGIMTSVTTMQAINDKIISLDYKDCKAEIKTADSQDAYKDGVIVLVTGCLTGKDNLRRQFAQSFFLAPQDKGYYVHNDVFRYVEEIESPETIPIVANGIVETAPTAPLTPDPEPAYVPDCHSPDRPASLEEGVLDNGGEVCNLSDNEEVSVIKVEVIMDPPSHSIQTEVQSQTEVHPVAELALPTIRENGPKKSYASILKVMKANKVPNSAYVPTSAVRVAPVNTEQQSNGVAAPAPGPESSAPISNDAHGNESGQEEVEGHSIYIRNLPLSALDEQVEEEFKKFGPIKLGGVQVRSNRQQGFCFGFVEFESLSSMRSAIEASPITFAGRQVYIEEKKTTSRVGSGRGRLPPGRGWLRNDSFRNRGNFGGGRGGYGRNEFGNRGEFSGRGRVPSGHSGDGYQRANQNGNGRVGHQGMMNHQTAVPV